MYALFLGIYILYRELSMFVVHIHDKDNKRGQRERYRDRHCQPVIQFVFDVLPIGSDKILSYFVRKYLK